ncbi:MULTISPECIES: hypothetical protein [unclassified Ochrobactrum]|jgi:hypothetical protein|uniref:hypothetical protein n=1 Tax=unclassified Ochrobactrum TaxID=239106 RepID=UPI0013B3D63F|nr:MULTISPECIES: hypothetical protein [unclassified Ochrobactrum]MBQ0707786.1 hypothetical protein [Ochrobactrum sp. AP1BH01-1]
MLNNVVRAAAIFTAVFSTAYGSYAKEFSELCAEHGGVASIYQDIVPDRIVDYSDYTDFYVSNSLFRLPNIKSNAYIRDQISKSIENKIPISVCYNTTSGPNNTVLGVSMYLN